MMHALARSYMRKRRARGRRGTSGAARAASVPAGRPACDPRRPAAYGCRLRSAAGRPTAPPILRRPLGRPQLVRVRPLGAAAVPQHGSIRVEALKPGKLGGVVPRLQPALPVMPRLQHDVEVASQDAAERDRLVTPSAQVRTEFLHHRHLRRVHHPVRIPPVPRGQQEVARRLLGCRRRCHARLVHTPLVAPRRLAADEPPRWHPLEGEKAPEWRDGMKLWHCEFSAPGKLGKQGQGIRWNN